jgi:hypothetical protein
MTNTIGGGPPKPTTFTGPSTGGRGGGAGPAGPAGTTNATGNGTARVSANVAQADDALFAPIGRGVTDEATFTGTVKSGTSTTANGSLAPAARDARAASLALPDIAGTLTSTSGVLAEPSKVMFSGTTAVGLAKRAADSLGETAKRASQNLGTVKTLGDKGNARTGIVTNGIAAASNTVTAVKTGDMRAAPRAGGDALNSAGSAYDTLSQRNPAAAQHWVVGSRYFAAASVVSVGRAAVDTAISAGKTVAKPTQENARQLANDAGRLAASSGAASFTVTAAKNATAGAIAKKTGEEFAVVAAKVLPKAVDTALNVAVKRAPVLFAAADAARLARVNDGKSHPVKTTLAWIAMGGSVVATVGMLTANPVLVAAGGAISLAAGTASDVVDR